jgi:DNA-directed RNA polymerase I subunit RPA12
MSAIGSLVFCLDCGNLLDTAAGKEKDHGSEKAILTCEVCGARCRGMRLNLKNAQEPLTDVAPLDTSSKTVVTVSKPTAFPSSLRAKRSEVQTISEEDVQTTSVIKQTCEKCGREEVRYYTQQLRSADEGTTVFYECDCGNKYVHSSTLNPEPILTAILQMEHQQLNQMFFILMQTERHTHASLHPSKPQYPAAQSHTPPPHSSRILPYPAPRSHCLAQPVLGRSETCAKSLPHHLRRLNFQALLPPRVGPCWLPLCC